MRLRRLTLTNYRGFRGKHTFEFGEEFTVVAGINGRGKSSILDALATLLSKFLTAVSLASGRQRTLTDADITNGEEELRLEIDLVCIDLPITFWMTRNRTAGRTRTHTISTAVKEHVRHIYGDPMRPEDECPMAVYYSTNRAICKLPRELPKISWLSAGSAAYRNALSDTLIDFKELMHRIRLWRASGETRPLNALKTATKSFLDSDGELLVETDTMQLAVHKGRERLYINQLSDGERAFIALLGDLVRRLSLPNIELENPLEAYGVVLVDELELHLHPRWQRHITEKLRTLFPNIQFVGTTHSPFIVQTLRDGELIALDPELAGEYSNRGLEEIAMSVMGIEDPEVSPRYIAMLEAAKAYFEALEAGRETTGPQRAALKRRLTRLSRRYADNPAYQAFLELKRTGILKE